MNTIGSQIRARRDSLGISLRELAKRIGISPPFLSDIERGRRMPSQERLAVIGGILNFKPHELAAYDFRGDLELFKSDLEREPELASAFVSAMRASIRRGDGCEPFVKAFQKISKQV